MYYLLVRRFQLATADQRRGRSRQLSGAAEVERILISAWNIVKSFRVIQISSVIQMPGQGPDVSGHTSKVQFFATLEQLNGMNSVG
jgi:hypothetical protein